MDNLDLYNLSNHIENLDNIKNDCSEEISRFLTTLNSVEKKLDRRFNLSQILESLKTTLDGIDVDTMFGFLDSLESEVNDLSYKYRKAIKVNTFSVTNKIITPTHFKL